MKRVEIENAAVSTLADARKMITANPIGGFVTGVVIGVLITAAPRGVLFFLFFVGLAAGIIWHLGEHDRPKCEADSKKKEQNDGE